MMQKKTKNFSFPLFAARSGADNNIGEFKSIACAIVLV